MANILDLSGATLQRRIVVAASGGQNTTLENYITVEEDPSDISTVTRHPVDTGAIMSDHIILQPPELRTRLGWSNADTANQGDAAYVANIYAQILQLKNNRQLMQVYTGKRYYTNMWPADIHGPRTDSKSEWSIIVDIHWVQLLLVNLANPTQSAQPNSTTTNPDPNAQTKPPVTAPTQSGGPKQIQPQTSSNFDTPPDALQSGGTTTGEDIPALPPTITNSSNGGAGPAFPFVGATP